MAKVESGAIDATLLAAAGLDRLGLAVGATIETDVMLPASAQGAVGITARAGDAAALALLAAINHPDTFAAVSLERGFLAGLGGTCHSPVAALATIAGNRVTFRAEIMTEDGDEIEKGGFEAPLAEAPALVQSLATDMLGRASPALRALFAAG
jgi:hydroxymethylbilane synthase